MRCRTVFAAALAGCASHERDASGGTTAGAPTEPASRAELVVTAPSLEAAVVVLDGVPHEAPLFAFVEAGPHELIVRCPAETCGREQILLDETVTLAPRTTREIEAWPAPGPPADPRDRDVRYLGHVRRFLDGTARASASFNAPTGHSKVTSPTTPQPSWSPKASAGTRAPAGG